MGTVLESYRAIDAIEVREAPWVFRTFEPLGFRLDRLRGEKGGEGRGGLVFFIVEIYQTSLDPPGNKA